MKFGEIIGGEVIGLSALPEYCGVRVFRTFKVSILGRNSTSPLDSIFWFQSTKIPGKTLNLGFLALLEKEVAPIVRLLTKQNITVTSIEQKYLFSKPNMINVFFQSVENPFQFAKKMRVIVNKLPFIHKRPTPGPSRNKKFRILCKQFNNIIGGSPNVIGDWCESVKERDIKVTVMGIPTTILSTRLLAFSFQSVDANGRALCIGMVTLKRNETKRFLAVLNKQAKTIPSSLYSRWFIKPNLIYLNFVRIQKPLVFAKQMNQAVKVLNDHHACKC